MTIPEYFSREAPLTAEQWARVTVEINHDRAQQDEPRMLSELL